MSRNIQTIVKFLPQDLNEYESLFSDCNSVRKMSIIFTNRIMSLLNTLKDCSQIQLFHAVDGCEVDLQEIEDVLSTLEELVKSYNTIFQNFKRDKHVLIMEKFKVWKDLIWKLKLKVVYFLQELMMEIAHMFVNYGERLLVLTLRISCGYNELLSMDSKYSITNNMSVCSNSCPYLMYPLRKFSVTKLLQIIANRRAELCCHKLIDCLLDTYKLYESTDDDSSDNSSIEIYRALTKHMTPPLEIAQKSSKSENGQQDAEHSGSFINLEEVISYEEKNISDLLEITLTNAPLMLGSDGVRKTSTGGTKVSSKAKEKVLDYYQQILWGEVAVFLEHIVLWWGSSPLSSRSPHSSQHLREWLNQFIPTAEIPQVILSALTSLADALGVHVTSTMWDQHFRLALVASKTTCHPDTGKLFSDVLQDLVMLSNQCEMTPDWIVGAPLDELPLVEQIPILHRLDHSIHTTRLWAINESKKLANKWNVDAFFKVTQSDIKSCLFQLEGLKLTDHSLEIEKGGLGVHVQVCSLMRAKLVSEVQVNIQKLKDAPAECVDVLASVCRTISLANLQMIFPQKSYWQIMDTTLPERPSRYVTEYLDRILTPVLLATSDHIITNMILKLLCESWLDHIYMHKIKFSQYGAYQLLIDFGQIQEWLMESSHISPKMKRKMAKNEVLRRCEGVGRLLLRHPGEHIKMVDKTKRASATESSENSPESEHTEQMPAEMYVPNQEQWLELRAVRKKNPFASSLCC